MATLVLLAKLIEAEILEWVPRCPDATCRGGLAGPGPPAFGLDTPGHALASLGAGEQADAVFEEAFGLAPDRGRLAEAGEHLREGRAQECERICRDLLARRPEDVNAQRLLAKVAGEAERWGRAERLLLRVLELAPGFHDARLDLSRVFKQQDRLEDAVRCAADAVDGNPRNPNAHYLHASMLALTGRHEEALAAYRCALDISPTPLGRLANAYSLPGIASITIRDIYFG